MRWEVTGGDSGHDDLGCTTRYAIRTARPRQVRVRRTYSGGPRGKLPCASGRHTRYAGGRYAYPVHTARLRHEVGVEGLRGEGHQAREHLGDERVVLLHDERGVGVAADVVQRREGVVHPDRVGVRLRVVGEGVPCLCPRVCPSLCLRVQAEAPVPEPAQADRVARPHTEHPARPEAGIRTQDALAHALAPDEGER
eukprot:scaffold49582_cov75-Phaeocystis_antarctica.AAC.7